jgi:hypothetical protein
MIDPQSSHLRSVGCLYDFAGEASMRRTLCCTFPNFPVCARVIVRSVCLAWHVVQRSVSGSFISAKRKQIDPATLLLATLGNTD